MKLLIGMFLAILVSLSWAVTADSPEEVDRLKVKVYELELKTQRAEEEYLAVRARYMAAKAELDKLTESKKPTSRKIGAKTDELPSPLVFNNKRVWNPEKILWNNKFFKCGKYLDDGSCEFVREMTQAELNKLSGTR